MSIMRCDKHDRSWDSDFSEECPQCSPFGIVGINEKCREIKEKREALSKRKRSMNQFEFRAFLDLMMCSDPWPVQDKDGNQSWQDVLVWYANNLALEFGFKSWVIAYHEHQTGVAVKKEHDSDCAVHNMPAYPNGKCDCGVTPNAK